MRKISISLSDMKIMLAAFLCYSGMYAVRKSFLAGQYDGMEVFGLDYKTVLVISQVVGYLLSKFIGIKIVSELSGRRPAKALVGLVSFGLLMLLAFAFVPSNFKPIFLFLNGLPLGMVFGLVLSYLEGRRSTELLAAGLSATFIFSTSFVKTVGLWFLQDFGVSVWLMPFMTGLVFFPIFLVAVWFLDSSKTPSEEDVEERSQRVPMVAQDRKDFLKKYGLAFSGLVMMYLTLTIIRDFRDNFIVDFWSELGYADQPEILTLTEIPVAIIVLLIAAAGILIKSNTRAFKIGMYLCLAAGVLIFINPFLFKMGLISPVMWIMASGLGVYLPYILFHTTVFERFISMLRFTGNVGFMFYIADSLGYTGSVLILLVKEFSGITVTWVDFFLMLNVIGGVLLVGLAAGSILLSARKSRALKRVQMA